MVRELLHVMPIEQLKAVSSSGDAALHIAVRRKDIDMVRLRTNLDVLESIQPLSWRMIFYFAHSI